MLLPLIASLALAPAFPYRWVYMQTNFYSNDEVAKVKALMRRAAKVGYNGFVIADMKIQASVPPQDFYRRNVQSVLEEAARDHIELIPSVLPIGWAEGELSLNPSLIEAMPVRDQEFVVKGGSAQPSQEAAFRNGGFEEARGDAFDGFSFQDGVGKATFADHNVVHGGSTSLRMEDPASLADTNGNCRVMQTVSLKPWRQYHFSAWAKTEKFDNAGSVRLLVLNLDGRQLSYLDTHVAKDQDWKRVDMVFNSQSNTKAHLYLGSWGGGHGKLWWDDVQLEELGPMNVVRRKGCPVKVVGSDGTVYREGADYAPILDPKGGNTPWVGQWEGYHDAPPVIIPKGSRIHDGERLKVSYYHAATTETGKEALCPSEPESKALEAAEIRRTAEMYRPKGYFLAHDEIRVMNWCEACQSRHLSPAVMLREDVKSAISTIRQSSPRAETFVWSDMFDPFHNAVENYYLVNGDLRGSWEGLPKSLVIVNWNQNNAQSLKFFADQGHRQILAGYYDNNPRAIRDWLSKAKGLPRIAGVMYTTWENKFEDLESFAKAAWGG